MGTAAVAYLGLVAVTSAVSFVAYGFDKSRAGSGGRRVPERTLHLLALAGGWPGALLGQRQFRHKTQKVPFRVVFWITVVVHVAVAAGVAYLVATRSGATFHPPGVSSNTSSISSSDSSGSANALGCAAARVSASAKRVRVSGRPPGERESQPLVRIPPGPSNGPRVRA
jgi:uncharacterized membrane protein YsdA (DUF1294 family)